jgi:hypothetical protein
MHAKLTLMTLTVVGLLFCTLATMELSELINLADDSSNDFSLVVFAENTVTAIKTRALPQGRPLLRDIQPRQADEYFQSHSLIRTFQASDDDMLHVLCVQRI